MAILGRAVAVTKDGDYVYETDPRAAFLAYSEYKDVPDHVVSQVEKRVAKSTGKPRRKPGPKPKAKPVVED